MSLEPADGIHREDRTHEQMTATRQHHHERRHPPRPTGERVLPQPEIPVVDLGFIASRDFRAPQRHRRCLNMGREFELHIPAETRDRHVQAVIVAHALMHSCHRVRGQHRLDQRPVHVDRRVRERPRFRVNEFRVPPLHQRQPLRPRQPWATRRDPRRDRRGDIPGDRATIHPHRRCHHRVRAASMPMLQNFDDVDHVERSPCHKFSLAPIDASGTTPKAEPNRWTPPLDSTPTTAGLLERRVRDYLNQTPKHCGIT